MSSAETRSAETRSAETRSAETLGVRPFAEIARGPVASVFKAYDAEVGAVVLLKALRPAAVSDPERRARFAAEARLAARVAHPNVVRVLRADDRALVAEWVEGETLAERLDASGALAPGLAAAVVREAARGLAAVHAAGIVHRDVKPANILIGDDGTVRLTDFGLASLAPDAAAGEEVRGTLATMAPEIVRGEAAGPASDVFSLGAVLAHTLTGRSPFGAETPSATLDAVLHTDAGAQLHADPRIPHALAAVAAAALHRDPTARPTAAALAGALDALLDETDGPAAEALADPAAAVPRLRAPVPAPATHVPRRRRGPLVGGALVATALVAGAVAALVSNPERAAERPPEASADGLGSTVIEASPRRGASARVAGATDSSAARPNAASVVGEPQAGVDSAAAPRPLSRPADRTPPAASPAESPDRPTPSAPAEVPPARVPDRPVAPGTLVAAAEPWATVRADGRLLGTTPVRTSLPPGVYELTFANPGFPTSTRTVRVEPGETVRADVSLWALVARVTLDVAPWAEVHVDGEVWDTVPPQARPLVLTPGTHTLRFEHPTLGRREQTLRVAAGESRTVRVRMSDP